MNIDPELKQHGHPRFYELLEEIAELHSRKNHDYATKTEPLSNLKQCAKIGIPPWKGCIVRLQDKWDRIIGFANTDVLMVKDESVNDTLKDNAVYSLLCIILREESDAVQETKPD